MKQRILNSEHGSVMLSVIMAAGVILVASFLFMRNLSHHREAEARMEARFKLSTLENPITNHLVKRFSETLLSDCRNLNLTQLFSQDNDLMTFYGGDTTGQFGEASSRCRNFREQNNPSRYYFCTKVKPKVFQEIVGFENSAYEVITENYIQLMDLRTKDNLSCNSFRNNNGRAVLGFLVTHSIHWRSYTAQKGDKSLRRINKVFYAAAQ